MKRFAIPAVRWSLSLIFLYFGFSQLVNPALWVGWLPAEASIVPVAAESLIVFNGVFEVALGLLLLIGVFTRVVASLLALHLAAITLSIGFTEVGVRDFGLTVATLAVALHGADEFGMDHWLASRDRRRR